MTRPNPARAGSDGPGGRDQDTPSLGLIGDGAIIKNEWDARALTNQIKWVIDRVGNLPEMVAAAYDGRVWTFLGYPSWDAYCVAELDTERITIPREERQEVVASLRESGLSIRAIASATGTGVATVKRSLGAGVPNGTPDAVLTQTGTVVGLDGKNYRRPTPPAPPTKPRRPPLVEGYTKALWDIEKIVRRLQRFHEDDRFASKRDQLREGQAGLVEMLRNNLDDLLAELHEGGAR